jgi:hypothetical protein
MHLRCPDIQQWETLNLVGSSDIAAHNYLYTPNYSLAYLNADVGLCLDNRQWTSRSEAHVDWPAGYTDRITGLPYSYVQSTNSATLGCGGGGGGGGGGCYQTCSGANGPADGAAEPDLTAAPVTVTAVATAG